MFCVFNYIVYLNLPKVYRIYNNKYDLYPKEKNNVRLQIDHVVLCYYFNINIDNVTDTRLSRRRKIDDCQFRNKPSIARQLIQFRQKYIYVLLFQVSYPLDYN